MSIRSTSKPKKGVYKALHPKVANILAQLMEPSPVNLVRDAFQPISGYLYDKPLSGPTENYITAPLKIEKKNVTLHLSLNQMKSRRSSMANS
jgi:hypothetical protein